MFSTPQIIYTVVSFLIIIVLAILSKKLTEKTRLITLRVIAFLTLFIHLSILPYSLLTDPTMPLYSQVSALWPRFFCNLMMWLLFITFCFPKPLKKLYPFVLWGSLFGGVITMFSPKFYDSLAGFWDYENFKGYLSHSLMILSFFVAVVSGEYKIRVKDMMVVFGGFAFTLIWGLFTNSIFEAHGFYNINSMYLQAPAISGTIFNGYFLAFLICVIIFIASIIVEWLTLKKEERFVNIFISKIKRHKK